MMIEIKKSGAKWLANGKQYKDLSGEEKKFFDEFMLAMRWQYECENYDQRKKKHHGLRQRAN
jgi:hypothetical protein